MSAARVVLLGTGSAQFSLVRAAPALAVLGGDSAVVVNCGAGVIRQLALAGREPASITGLLLVGSTRSTRSAMAAWCSAAGAVVGVISTSGVRLAPAPSTANCSGISTPPTWPSSSRSA